MSDQLLGSFVWCELLTTDTSAAGTFYKKVVGWKTAPWGNDSSYTTFNTSAGPVAGMMVLPDDAKKMGAPPNWMMYVGTPNVEDTATKIAQLGGKTLRQPEDIPNAGRFAVVQDPYGAVFGIYKPGPTAKPKGQPGVGDFSWYELYTPNPEGAWNFYHTLFGWEKTSAMDMGDMGVYQMFGRGAGIPNGGIMKPPPGAPAAWMPYAMVADAKAAAKRAQAAGGKIVNGPMEVPGGDWIAQGMDPQGAMFSVHSRKPAAAAAPPAAEPAARAAKPATAAAKPAVTSAAPKKAAAAKAKAPAVKASASAKATADKKAAKKAPKKAAKKAAKKSAKSARRGAAKKASKKKDSKKSKKKASKKKEAKRAKRKAKKR